MIFFVNLKVVKVTKVPSSSFLNLICIVLNIKSSLSIQFNSQVSREVDAREKELTHQVHREILIRCLDQVKTLAPILICSMKIYIHIISQGGKGAEEAAENRNYLTAR